MPLRKCSRVPSRNTAGAVQSVDMQVFDWISFMRSWRAVCNFATGSSSDVLLVGCSDVFTEYQGIEVQLSYASESALLCAIATYVGKTHLIERYRYFRLNQLYAELAKRAETVP